MQKYICKGTLWILMAALQIVFGFSVAAVEKKEEITHIGSSNLYFSGHMIPIGDEEEWQQTQELVQDNLLYLAGYNDNGGEAILSLTNLDISSIDIYTKGVYNIIAELEVDEDYAEEYFLSPELSTIEIPVCVSDPSEFELFLSRTTEFHHIIYFLPEFEWESAEIYYYTSDTQYTYDDLEFSNWELCRGDIALMKNSSFAINRKTIPQKQYIYFYVKFGDLMSQVIEVYESGEFYSIISIGGDRDGGDTNLNLDPIITQPAPLELPETTTVQTTETTIIQTTEPTIIQTTETTTAVTNSGSGDAIVKKQNNHVTVAETEKIREKENPVDNLGVIETSGLTEITTDAEVTKSTENVSTKTKDIQMEYSDTYVDALLGYRVHLMMESGGGVAKFSKNGITLEIPLGSITFQDDDIITVAIRPSTDFQSYSIEISINETAAMLNSDVTIWFPETYFESLESASLQINNSLQLLQYDSESGAYYIRTKNLGEFVITSEASGEESEGVTVGVIVIATILILVTGAVFGFRYFRRKHPA